MHERFSDTQFRNLLNWVLLLCKTSALYFLYFQVCKGEREIKKKICETRRKRQNIVNKMNSSLYASGRTFISLFCNFKVHRLILSAVHAIPNVESNLSFKRNFFNSPSISRFRTWHVFVLWTTLLSGSATLVSVLTRLYFNLFRVLSVTK